MSLCNTCKKADVSCPVYPQDTQTCVEYSRNNQCDGCNAGMPLIQGVHYYGNTAHMVCANGFTGVSQLTVDIASRLQKLATEMRNVATVMSCYDEFTSYAKYSLEMIETAELYRELASEILVTPT